MKTLADDADKRFTDRKATDLKRTEPKAQKFGSSDGKWLRINYNDSEGVARTCMIFVLSGEKYTVSAVAEFRDQDKEDVGPWVMNALRSIRPLIGPFCRTCAATGKFAFSLHSILPRDLPRIDTAPLPTKIWGFPRNGELSPGSSTFAPALPALS